MCSSDLGMTSRPRRRSSRVSENYDDNHLWEDGAVYAGRGFGFMQQNGKTPWFLIIGG